jgi:hypothetical protein
MWGGECLCTGCGGAVEAATVLCLNFLFLLLQSYEKLAST